VLANELFERFKKKRPVGLMAKLAMERLLSPAAIDQVFLDFAQEQYERKIRFSAITELMASMTLGFSPSVNSAYQKLREKLVAARSCVFNKLDRVEPRVVQALVRYSYRQTREICDELGTWSPGDLRGYFTKIVDGNHLSGTEHRLKEMRRERAAALPGKSLVVLAPRYRAIADMFPIEDGHAQERSVLDDVLETVEERDLWVGDRNFCTHKFLYSVDARAAAFVIRHHQQVVGKLAGQRVFQGRSATGRVYEQVMELTEYEGKRLSLRRIEVDLLKPTRDHEKTVVLLTNLPSPIEAVKIAEIYLGRWRIETAFQTLTTTLRCEVKALCYPRAALFTFATALLAYNAVAVIEAAICSEHGQQTADRLSKYYMALEIATAMDGMTVALEDHDFDRYRKMSTPKFCAALRNIARHIDLSRYCKNERGPKKPIAKKRHKKQNVHISVAKLLAQRK
jgi:hypothetical protein